MSKPKTWARETAGVLLLALGWTLYQENIALVTVIVWPILSYAAVAFGLKRVDGFDKLLSPKAP